MHVVLYPCNDIASVRLYIEWYEEVKLIAFWIKKVPWYGAYNVEINYLQILACLIWKVGPVLYALSVGPYLHSRWCPRGVPWTP